MAVIGRLAAFISLDSKKFSRGLSKVQMQTESFVDRLGSLGRRVTAFGSVLASSVVGLSIKRAGDAQESLSRFRAIFGDQSAAANQFADVLGKSVGRSALAIKDGLSSFQGFFVGLGFGAEQARAFSQTLQRLSIDFASFHNLSDDESLSRFISALSGSSEVLDKFGVNIRQAALEQELLRMGVNKAWSQVTEQEKAVARLGVIMRVMTDQGAVGDAVRTSGSFTNQLKRLRASFNEFIVQLGQSFLPTATKVVQALNDMSGSLSKLIPMTQQFVERNGGLIKSFAKLALGIGAVVFTAPKLVAAIKAITGAVGALASIKLGAVIASLLAIPGIALAGIASAVVGIIGAVDFLSSRAEREAAKLSQLADEAESMRMREEALARQRTNLSRATEQHVEQLNRQIEATKNAREEHERLLDQIASGIIERNLTPLERWSRGMMELNFAFRNGALTMQQWAREAARLKQELHENWLSPAEKSLKDFAQSIEESMRTPFEKAKMELDRIREAVAKGFLDPKFGGRRLLELANELFPKKDTKVDESRGSFRQIIRGRTAIGGTGTKSAEKVELEKQTSALEKMLNILDGIQFARAS